MVAPLACLPLADLWRPSAHQLPLPRFYRFVDPKLEAQYTHGFAPVWQTILRIYCSITFLLAVEEFVENPAPPLFWTLFCICAASLLLLVVSYWQSALPYALPITALYICVLGGVFEYQLKLEAQGLKARTMLDLYDPGAPTDALYHEMAAKVQYLVGRLQVRDGLLYSCVHWVTLALVGFNGWTVLAYTATFVSFTVGMLEDPIVVDKGVALFYVVVCTIGFSLVSVVMERVRRSDILAQVQLARELQASQLADSVLNHMLKNTLADVAADIEIFLAGELGPEVLEDAVVCLRRGIRSCRERLVYLKMVAGEYAPVTNAINLKEFGHQLVAGRNVATQLVDSTVLLDGTLMQLILENALSNAFKHGHPDHPDVELLVTQRVHDPGGFPPRRQIVSFIVKNTTHPLRPKLTTELVQLLFHGEARLQPRAVVPTLSDGIGILHCMLAARLGGIELALQQEGDVVTFTATVEVDVPEAVASSPTEDEFCSLAHQFPPGLKIFCLDDSTASRRLMEFHLKRCCPSAVVRTYGSCEDDVYLFVTEALQEADIVILDQNLEYTRTHYGTDLCRQLVGHGFRGLVCIRSSDDSQEDQLKYSTSGAHCSFGKDMLGAKMVQRLKAAYVMHIVRPPFPVPRPSAFPNSMSNPCMTPTRNPPLVWNV